MKNLFPIAFVLFLASCAAPTPEQIDHQLLATSQSYQALTGSRQIVLSGYLAGFISAADVAREIKRQSAVRLAIDSGLILESINAPGVNLQEIARLRAADDAAAKALQDAITSNPAH